MISPKKFIPNGQGRGHVATRKNGYIYILAIRTGGNLTNNTTHVNKSCTLRQKINKNSVCKNVYLLYTFKDKEYPSFRNFPFVSTAISSKKYIKSTINVFNVLNAAKGYSTCKPTP